MFNSRFFRGSAWDEADIAGYSVLLFALSLVLVGAVFGEEPILAVFSFLWIPIYLWTGFIFSIIIPDDWRTRRKWREEAAAQRAMERTHSEVEAAAQCTSRWTP